MDQSAHSAVAKSTCSTLRHRALSYIPVYERIRELICTSSGIFDTEQVGLLQTRLGTRMPGGSEMAAYLTTAALWPWELPGAQIYVG